ncbi:hypothetical protein BGX30_007230 [Mortierella sp. GBA39]|nr:hypothetical protein BGX30_007230 [Mortierella sp. GBA39]
MSNETTYNNNNAELPTLQQLDINATDAVVVTSSSPSEPILEDIEMADQYLGDPSPSMDDHPIPAGQEPDLRFSRSCLIRVMHAHNIGLERYITTSGTTSWRWNGFAKPQFKVMLMRNIA